MFTCGINTEFNNILFYKTHCIPCRPTRWGLKGAAQYSLQILVVKQSCWISSKTFKGLWFHHHFTLLLFIQIVDIQSVTHKPNIKTNYCILIYLLFIICNFILSVQCWHKDNDGNFSWRLPSFYVRFLKLYFCKHRKNVTLLQPSVVKIYQSTGVRTTLDQCHTTSQNSVQHVCTMWYHLTMCLKQKK